ncbi:MAG: beta-lactamase family protein, partial [Kiritimatiellae bacterium]|nr:beta-lactamase family protein [Kiritimatiellia bacterium]
CLNHTGGFPFEIPAKSPNVPGGGWSGGMPIRSAAATAASQPILFEPGTAVRYSNTGIDIAAAVVQTIAGEPWEDFLQKRVLDPLGMTETRFKPTDAQVEGKVEMYDCHGDAPATWKSHNNQEQRPYNDAHVFPSAGAGLWTTARDQVKFYRMLMNGGVGDNGVRILQEDTVRSLLATSSRPKGLGGYSLGLNATEDGNGWFGHGGAWGTNCQVNMDKRQLKLWVVQLNGNPRPWDKAKAAAEDAFFAESLDRTAEDAYTGRTE